MLIALLIIAVLGCIVRGYYMFMVGFDLDTRSYSTFPTSIIGFLVFLFNYFFLIFHALFRGWSIKK